MFDENGFAQIVGADPASVPDGLVARAYVYVRVDEVGEAVARLEAAGARRLSPPAPRSWGETAAWFADPDGNVVAVAETTTAPVAPPGDAATHT